jgi:hypothetical protein
MAENSEYILEPLREREDFTVYRGRERGNQMPILAVAAAAEQPSPQSLRRLEHEYSLATELDSAWAAQPLALTHHQGRAVLVLKDPGGDPLDWVIEHHKGQPIDLSRFLHIAIGLAGALGQAHRQGLIHKDVKPANALVDDSGHVWFAGFGIVSRLPRERLTPAPPEIIAGTLAYISDDAEVTANFIGIAPVVEGPVVELPIHDNDLVKKGGLLYKIDDRPYLYALQNALAAQAELEGEIDNESRRISSQVNSVDVAWARHSVERCAGGCRG